MLTLETCKAMKAKGWPQDVDGPVWQWKEFWGAMNVQKNGPQRVPIRNSCGKFLAVEPTRTQLDDAIVEMVFVEWGWTGCVYRVDVDENEIVRAGIFNESGHALSPTPDADDSCEVYSPVADEARAALWLKLQEVEK